MNKLHTTVQFAHITQIFIYELFIEIYIYRITSMKYAKVYIKLELNYYIYILINST